MIQIGISRQFLKITNDWKEFLFRTYVISGSSLETHFVQISFNCGFLNGRRICTSSTIFFVVILVWILDCVCMR